MNVAGHNAHVAAAVCVKQERPILVDICCNALMNRPAILHYCNSVAQHVRIFLPRLYDSPGAVLLKLQIKAFNFFKQQLCKLKPVCVTPKFIPYRRYLL